MMNIVMLFILSATGINTKMLCLSACPVQTEMQELNLCDTQNKIAGSQYRKIFTIWEWGRTSSPELVFAIVPCWQRR
jgi:hypothetical protein